MAPASAPIPDPPSAAPFGTPSPTRLDFGPDHHLAEIYQRASNPDDPTELRNLYLGRIEDALGARSTRPALAGAWRAARTRRTVTSEEILASQATIRFVKEMFNHYFRDDLYGSFRRPGQLILSSGAVDEETWGLPAALKECISYALERDWYGYSDSRGREPAREAVAAYESAKLQGAGYDLRNVALTMGGTFALNSVADFALTGRSTTAPVLCAIPNYPPLVESLARRADVRLVPTPSVAGRTSLAPLLAQLRPDTPLVLLQTAANPTGALVDEDELTELIRRAGRNTLIVLDECHEWLGPRQQWSAARAADNVVRISSLSKNWSAPGLKIGWLLAARSFIDAYYEYASSSYGGPPSFFYTVIEVLARLERWRMEGRDVGLAELAEFESGYGMSLDGLGAAYRGYVADRDTRETDLLALRDAVTGRLRMLDTEVAHARYSINLAVRLRSYEDSYLAFRDLLDQHDVSVFPGLLTFCLSGGVVRITTARPWSELSPALSRMQRFLADRRRVGSLAGEG
ncbi:aminotransferase class I/II-fold pyridoxal phosphate-dependent enzyme [Streptomyces sp. NPDC056670]|uniref:aminotransferase class I/II-fold pyridoxal phosphate-dependent enzyme n=1 Tax=Streptomyces sp. NPDC056670 TaxID=3345904 RepID=UPI0036C2C93E